MSQFPYSKTRVSKIGKKLAGELIWNEENEYEIREIFDIANSWRESHQIPMSSIRSSISQRVRKLGLHGITVGRLKRMPSIRRKLQQKCFGLDQLQDLGGCRCIVPSITAANKLAASLQNDSKHKFRKEDNYILNPKESGYRCRHLIFEYQGSNSSNPYTGRRIEVQIRSRLQHSWATAVEVVGTFNNEYLKGSHGNEDWLRLFKLMSGEISFAENCDYGVDKLERAKRSQEIKALESKLNAVQMLENIRFAIDRSNFVFSTSKERPNYFLIKYDNQKRKVTVNGQFRPSAGAKAYRIEEQDIVMNNLNSINSVLVEVEKVENLQDAFPNYFGDVQLFIQNLKRVTRGKEAIEYTMPPLSHAPKILAEASDPSWFYQHRYRRWQHRRSGRINKKFK